MNITIGYEKFFQLLFSQLQSNFLCEEIEKKQLKEAINIVEPKIEYCWKNINYKYFHHNSGEIILNPYHTGQYAIFLYFLSSVIYNNIGNIQLADKLYYLNKMLNACDLFYEIELPDIFLLEHPVGTVLGRAKYSNYFMFQQNCTVGGNKGVYPELGEYVWLFANSTIIGASKIGNNVFVAAGTIIKDTNIPNNSIVFGKTPNLIVKSKETAYFFKKSPFLIHRNN